MSSNSFLFRRVRTLMFALTALPLVSHAAVETIAKGQLTYGTAATFMPFEYVKAGKLTGFDIDLINALSKEIQLTPAPMPMEFKGLIPALQGKRLDIINSAMYVNPTRAEQVDFVPYLKIGSRVVVRKGNPANITGRDLSLCGKNIAVTLGGIEESQARADNQRCVEAKKPAINVMTFPAATDSAVAVAQGRAEAVGAEFEANTHIAFAVRKGDTATQALLEQGLQSLVKNGTYTQLIKKWNFPDSVALF